MKRLISWKNILFILIVLFCIILRFSYLDDPGGLWYDEIVSYKESSQSGIFDIVFYTLYTDVHLPFYQVLLHFWAKIFSFSDFSLRSFSVICGILTVVASFFVGKELKSEKTGLICASVFALNSFLIYYSQCVRPYALLIFFSTMLALFLVRIKNDLSNYRNYFFMALFSFAVISTYTTGFIFVFIQLFVFFLYFAGSKNENKIIFTKNFYKACKTLLILSLPLALYFIFNYKHYSGQINGYYCDASCLLVVLQNWFSPVLVGLNNNPVHYAGILFSNFDYYKFIFVIVPIVLSVYFITIAVKKSKFSLVLLVGALGFLLVEIIAVIFTEFKILTRYTAAILPNILILLGYGISLLNFQIRINRAFVILFFSIQIFFLAFSDAAAYKIPRNGFKRLAKVLNDSGLKKDDFVLVWNRKEVLTKYVRNDLNYLSLLKNFAYTSEVVLYNEDELNKLPVVERKRALRQYFASSAIPVNTIYLMNQIYNHADKGQKFVITANRRFDTYDQDAFTRLVNDDEQFNLTSYNDLLSINSLIHIKKLCYQKFKLVKKVKTKRSVVIIFEKP